MKRVVSLILCLCVMLSLGVCASALTFSDLASNHWAHNDIMTLVNEGTINGYEDGTFKPSKSVTRAEFVKMIGKWDQKYQGTYTDLPENHWAYEYIMWSGLDSVGTVIYPDAEIKRGEVINLIWKRNGSPKHNLAPKAITKQGTNPDATSWAYTIGLMKGDDGLNLRLDSSLTRAEAATLIIRSREVIAANAKNNFIDLVSDELLATVYNSLNLGQGEYSANEVFTYGEIARMVMTFGADGSDIVYGGNDIVSSELFEHKYSKDMYTLSSKVWGKEYYNQSKIEQPATVQDVISAFMYGFVRRGTAPLDMSKLNAYYPDCTDAESTTRENLYLTYACINGIKLYAGENLGANEQINHKKFTALMLQLNSIIGLGVSYVNGEKTNAKINTYLYSYPLNFKDYYAIIENVPAGVYSLKSDATNASEYYKMASLCEFVFNDYLAGVKALAKSQTGYDVDTTYYPALTYEENGKTVFVAKISVKGEDGTVSVDRLLEKVLKEPSGKNVKLGSEFYVVFETYESLMDVYLPISGAYVKEVIIP